MTDRQGTGPKIATYRHQVPPGAAATSAAARIDGTLSVVEGCLVIAGASLVQPVFAEGSARWDEGTQRLMYKGSAYRIGSTIVLGGGGITNAAEYLAQPGVSIPRCGTARLFVVGP